MWQLIDNTGTSKGYLRIMRDGKRVADVFPYAVGVDAQWTIEQAQHVVDTMNRNDMKPSIISQLSDDPPARIPDDYHAPLDDRSTLEMMADRDGTNQQQAGQEK